MVLRESVENRLGWEVRRIQEVGVPAAPSVQSMTERGQDRRQLWSGARPESAPSAGGSSGDKGLEIHSGAHRLGA